MDIHRTVWKNLLKKQEIICKHCGSLITIDIDLDRIVMTEEDQKLLDSRTDWSTVEVNLPAGYDFVSPSVAGDATKRPYADLEGHTFNHMIFRTPTLRDAIKNEKYYADTITFWRRIAYDCLQTFDEIDENGRPTGFEMPTALLSQLGMKLFDSILFSEDLDAIRKGIRDEVPTLPFWYDEECPTCRQSTPVAMETTDFFSA